MPLSLLSGVGQELLHRGAPEAIEGFGILTSEDAHEGDKLGETELRQFALFKRTNCVLPNRLTVRT